MQNNHLTIGIYTNGQWKYNVVRDEDIKHHIEYNKTWRPGRLLYVDGKRVWNGMYKEEYCAKYDAIEKEVREIKLKNINMNNPTIPYR